MNKISRYVLVVFVLASMLLGACAGAAPSVASDGGKVEASSVAYTGTIESINGTQWVVNGQTITVDPSVVKDGPFNIGDLVKVEVQVAQDGTVTVTRVELPSQVDMSQLPGLGDDNSNDANDNDANGNDVNGNDANGNDVNGNDANGNDANGNDDNSNNANGNDSNSNDGNSNSGNEVSGVVEAITTTSVTVNGLTYEFQSGVEIKDLIQAGDFVKIHLVQNADGTFSVREMELSDPSQVGNGNDSNSNDGNGNDDNGNDDNSNGNSNDDDDDDDDDGNGNNDDNGGQGGGNDNGGNGNG